MSTAPYIYTHRQGKRIGDGPPIKNGQGHVREGSGVGFWVRLFVMVSLQGLFGRVRLVSRVSFKGLSVFEYLMSSH